MTEPRLTATTLYPPGYSQALRQAHTWTDPIARIDAINADLVRLGYCRPPQDMSLRTALVELCEARKRWEQVV